MKKIIFSALVLFAMAAHAQDKEKVQAAKGVVYGTVSKEQAPVTPDEVKDKLVNDKFDGQIRGKVVEVCTAEGCWIRLEKADGTTMMVRSKDHAFLMPANIVGKTVLVEGSATVTQVSEESRKHYAEDTGKSKEEIAQIKGSEKDVEFAAKGVKVLN